MRLLQIFIFRGIGQQFHPISHNAFRLKFLLLTSDSSYHKPEISFSSLTPHPDKYLLSWIQRSRQLVNLSNSRKMPRHERIGLEIFSNHNLYAPAVFPWPCGPPRKLYLHKNDTISSTYLTKAPVRSFQARFHKRQCPQGSHFQSPPKGEFRGYVPLLQALQTSASWVKTGNLICCWCALSERQRYSLSLHFRNPPDKSGW